MADADWLPRPLIDAGFVPKGVAPTELADLVRRIDACRPVVYATDPDFAECRRVAHEARLIAELPWVRVSLDRLTDDLFWLLDRSELAGYDVQEVRDLVRMGARTVRRKTSADPRNDSAIGLVVRGGHGAVAYDVAAATTDPRHIGLALAEAIAGRSTEAMECILEATEASGGDLIDWQSARTAPAEVERLLGRPALCHPLIAAAAVGNLEAAKRLRLHAGWDDTALAVGVARALGHAQVARLLDSQYRPVTEPLDVLARRAGV